MSETKARDEKRDTKNPVLTELAAIVGEARVTDTVLERVVYSGDPSALPQFHYRWKRKYLAEYVVKVKSTEEVQKVIEVARKHGKSIVPRGGASSCLGASSPTRGGITIDIKPMNQIVEINPDQMYVRIQPGVTFEQLNLELSNQGLELGIYPSSAKSAVVGGWIACGGQAGIGTPLHGNIRKAILGLTLVRADGEVVSADTEMLDLMVGSYGILGVFTEIKLRIHRMPPGVRTFSYGFMRIEGLCNAIQNVAALRKKPIYLKMADKDFQSYSNPLEKGRFVMTVAYPDTADACPETDVDSISAGNGGTYLGEDFSGREWDLRYDCEFNPKEHCDTLMFQELWVRLDSVYGLLRSFESYRKSHKVPALWFGMLGSSEMMRLELFAMLDPDRYLQFIGSKGVLHKIVKQSIKAGGGPYIIGLQNSVYMKRAYPEKLQQMRAAKSSLDSTSLLNPDKVTSCLVSYVRIDILFVLAAAFRRLAALIRS